MPIKKSRARGRITSDDRVNRIWEWEVQTGVFGSNVDTARIKALAPESLSVEAAESQKKTDFNPYNTTVLKRQPVRRRTLDDMRRLNDEIKRARGKTKD